MRIKNPTAPCICCYTHTHTHTHTHTRLTAPFPGLPGWAGTRKAKPNWILLKQETVNGSGISWAICKSAPRSRQTTMPAPQHSVFYRPDALPAAQPTASKHWRHCYTTFNCETIMSTKQTINDKLQGSVATYLRCDGVVNNQIKKGGLLLSLIVKKIKIGKYLAKLQARIWSFRTLSPSSSSALAKCTKCRRQPRSYFCQIFTDF